MSYNVWKNGKSRMISYLNFRGGRRLLDYKFYYLLKEVVRIMVNCCDS